MNTTITTNQDKLGKFHSCDRETYRKLKKARFFRHVERIQQARHNRWSRKLPKNRVKWVKAGFYSPTALSISYGAWNAEPWEEPELCPLNLNILDGEYRNAKISHDDPKKVLAMKLSVDGLEAMLETLYAWSDRCYGHRS